LLSLRNKHSRESARFAGRFAAALGPTASAQR
jgi:hypothetical protein